MKMVVRGAVYLLGKTGSAFHSRAEGRLQTPESDERGTQMLDFGCMAGRLIGRVGW